MTEAIVNTLTIVLASVGAFFFLVGTIGILRLPDFYCRTHAATKCDTLGAGAVLASLALFNGLDADALKILVIVVFVLLSSPTSGHALARAGYRTGLKPWKQETEREGTAS